MPLTLNVRTVGDKVRVFLRQTKAKKKNTVSDYKWDKDKKMWVPKDTG